MRKLTNRTWFKLHGWCALPVWVLFSFICLTGTISVISHELTWLANPLARAENPNNLPAKSPAQLVEKVIKQHPSAAVNRVLKFEDHMVHFVFFSSKNHPFAIAYVNQYSGEIQYVNQGMTFIYFMRSLHGWLLFPWQQGYSLGYYIVSIMSIFMLGALITGLVVYKKFWRSFFAPKLRFNQGSRTFMSDLHKLIGVWSLWFLIIISFTGLWYLAQAIIWHNDIELDPEIPAINQQLLPQNVSQSPTPNYSLADALQLSQQTYNDFEVEEIMMPEHNRDTIKLYGKGDFTFYDHHAYYLAFNSWNGKIEYQRSPTDMNLLQTMEHISDPLHFGYIGGIWTKIIWFIFGLTISAMPMTGYMMWHKRNSYFLSKNKGSENDNENIITTA